MTLRLLRWAWPLVFLVPLTLVAGRGCRFPGVDEVYHSVLWLHENLPLLFVLAAATSAIGVAVRLLRARGRAARLFALASPLPDDLVHAFEDERLRLQLAPPRIAYLDVAAPMCFVLVGIRPAIVISRGFAHGLASEDLRLVARHELLHIRRGDPLRGFLWHVAFAALLLPAFSALERALSRGRELRTHLESAEDDPERYATLLLAQARENRAMCVDTSAAEHASRFATYAPPLAVAGVLVALAFSHVWFLDHLALLTRDHC